MILFLCGMGTALGLILMFKAEYCASVIIEYKPLKIPEDMAEGLWFSRADSRQLDVFGKWEGVKRKRFLFIKEPSTLYKIRIRNKAIENKLNN